MAEQVFVSYSRADVEWRRAFEVMLKPLVRTGVIDLWLDRDIRAGQDWEREIEAAIARSTVALLLVSPEFLSSDFIMEKELPALVRARVRLFPVLVRDCVWKRVPELARLQWRTIRPRRWSAPRIATA